MGSTCYYPLTSNEKDVYNSGCSISFTGSKAFKDGSYIGNSLLISGFKLYAGTSWSVECTVQFTGQDMADDWQTPVVLSQDHFSDLNAEGRNSIVFYQGNRSNSYSGSVGGVVADANPKGTSRHSYKIECNGKSVRQYIDGRMIFGYTISGTEVYQYLRIGRGGFFHNPELKASGVRISGILKEAPKPANCNCNCSAPKPSNCNCSAPKPSNCNCSAPKPSNCNCNCSTSGSKGLASTQAWYPYTSNFEDVYHAGLAVNYNGSHGISNGWYSGQMITFTNFELRASQSFTVECTLAFEGGWPPDWCSALTLAEKGIIWWEWVGVTPGKAEWPTNPGKCMAFGQISEEGLRRQNDGYIVSTGYNSDGCGMVVYSKNVTETSEHTFRIENSGGSVYMYVDGGTRLHFNLSGNEVFSFLRIGGGGMKTNPRFRLKNLRINGMKADPPKPANCNCNCATPKPTNCVNCAYGNHKNNGPIGQTKLTEIDPTNIVRAKTYNALAKALEDLNGYGKQVDNCGNCVVQCIIDCQGCQRCQSCENCEKCQRCQGCQSNAPCQTDGCQKDAPCQTCEKCQRVPACEAWKCQRGESCQRCEKCQQHRCQYCQICQKSCESCQRCERCQR